jgi:hypothetical protein
VIVLLAAIPFSKLHHVLIRPCRWARAWCERLSSHATPAPTAACWRRAARRQGDARERGPAHGSRSPAALGVPAALPRLTQAALVGAQFHRRSSVRTRTARIAPGGDVAKPSAPLELLEQQYGPHLSFEPPGGFARARSRPQGEDALLCGQQCGVQLLVQDESVVGVEPWRSFLQRRQALPGGVKRYLQNNHPDRLLHLMVRTGNGFGRIRGRGHRPGRRRVRRLQAHHGPSVAVLSGASLTNEKAYLMGKFARLAVGTPHRLRASVRSLPEQAI